MTSVFLPAVVLVSFLALTGNNGCHAASYLFRKSWNAFNDMTSLVAVLEFERDVTFVETLGLESCVSSVQCPLAGFSLVGDSQGILHLLSHLGDIVLQADAPHDCHHECAITAASLLHVRQSRDCQYDILLLAYFSGLGLYGMPLEYVTMQGKGWAKLWNESVMPGIVEMQSFQGKLGSNAPGKDFTFAAFDADKRLVLSKGNLMCSDISLGPPSHGLEMDHDSSFIGTDVVSMHASRRLGVHFIDAKGFIHHIKWKKGEVKRNVLKRCVQEGTFTDEDLETTVVHGSFDASLGDLFATVILNTGRISRVKISKGKCREVHQTHGEVLLQQPTCMGLASSGGYSLISAMHAIWHQRAFTLYNHSKGILHDASTIWESEKYVSFSVSEEMLIKSTSLKSLGSKVSQAIQRVLTRLGPSASKATLCTVARIRMWKLRKLQGRNILMLLLPGRNTLFLYQPLFQTSQHTRAGGKSREFAQVITGILKSVTLIAAAVIGFRWAGAKKQEVPRYLGNNPTVGNLAGTSRTRKSHHTSHSIRMERFRRGVTTESSEGQLSAWGLRQESIDRAPQGTLLEENEESENSLHLL